MTTVYRSFPYSLPESVSQKRFGKNPQKFLTLVRVSVALVDMVDMVETQ